MSDIEPAAAAADEHGFVIGGRRIDHRAQQPFLPQWTDATGHVAGGALNAPGIRHRGLARRAGLRHPLQVQLAGYRHDRDRQLPIVQPHQQGLVDLVIGLLAAMHLEGIDAAVRVGR